jgi:predicted RND superfamily exporter protein
MTVGVFRLDVETDFTKNFRSNTPIVQSYQFVENNLGGAGVWDIILAAPKTYDNASLPSDYLALVRRLEQRLRDEVHVHDSETPIAGLTKVVSVADADEATKVSRLLILAGSRIRLRKMQSELNTFYNSMLNTEQIEGDIGYLRIMLRARERQSAAQKLHLIQDVEKVVAEEMETAEWKVVWASLRPHAELVEDIQAYFAPRLDEEVWRQFAADMSEENNNSRLLRDLHRTATTTLGEEAWTGFATSLESPRADTTGFFVLLTNLIKSMIRDQWICFGVATLGIGLMMLVAFRSLKIALIALVPNILPIFIVFGMMGWLGIWFEELKINMGAAMIAAVSMGLSVDSSIHYLTSFLRARSLGKSVHNALAEVQQSVGRATVFSTLALVVGFSILCTSNFVPTIYFGVLVSLSMLGGMFGNLMVLPMLLQIFCDDRETDLPRTSSEKDSTCSFQTS